MKYIPYLIAKNPDGTYAVVFNPGAPRRCGMIGSGDRSDHSPYRTIIAAKRRAESFGKNGGFTALNIGLIDTATCALGALHLVLNEERLDLDIIAELIDTLRLALPSVTPDDRG